MVAGLVRRNDESTSSSSVHAHSRAQKQFFKSGCTNFQFWLLLIRLAKSKNCGTTPSNAKKQVETADNDYSLDGICYCFVFDVVMGFFPPLRQIDLCPLFVFCVHDRKKLQALALHVRKEFRTAAIATTFPKYCKKRQEVAKEGKKVLKGSSRVG